MLTNWDLFAIIIALLGCLTVMGLFWKQNIEQQKEMLEGMLKELLTPRIQPALDEINAGGSYAILKVAE